MRRTSLIALAGILALAIVASPALARRHHHSRHHRHHVHLRRFGTSAATQPGSTSSSSPAPAAAGKITDMSGGQLTITLTGGGTVSGTVTSSTEVECPAADQESDSTMQTADDGPDGGSSGTSGSGGDSTQSGDDQSGDNQSGDDQSGDNQGDDDQGEDDAGAGSCTLAVGDTVQEAELSVSSSGAAWKKIELAA